MQKEPMKTTRETVLPEVKRRKKLPEIEQSKTEELMLRQSNSLLLQQPL